MGLLNLDEDTPVFVYGTLSEENLNNDNIPVEVYGCMTKKHLEKYLKDEESVRVYGVPTSYNFEDYSPFDVDAFFNKIQREELMKSPKLKNLFIEMTLNCNEHCKHCGSNCGDKRIDHSLSDVEIISCLMDLQEDMKDEELPFITVTGGKPLLRKGLPNLMKVINKMGYAWGMTSNATLITKEVAQQLKEAGLFSISVSIDGLEDTHNWFRESKNGFSLAVEGVKNLVEVGIPHIMITTVVHKKNINELDKIKELVKSLNCEIWRVINVDPIGRAKNNSEILLEGKDYKYILDYIVKNNSADLPIIYSCNYYLGDEYENKVRPWSFFCEAGLTVGSIQYNEDVGACLDIERNDKTKQGNIRERRFYDIWQNEFKIFRESRVEKSLKCNNCQHRSKCGGGGFHTWNIEKNEPEICMLEEIGELNNKG